jgi:Family of unknown function (DUF5681)
MRRKKPSDRHYDVGYGKPPQATRFQPGQSGNSRGRPKGSKNGNSLLEQTLDEIVILNEGGVTKRMTKREAFFKALVARALKHERFAGLLIKTMEKYDLMKPNVPLDTIKLVFVDGEPPDDDDDIAAR